MPLDIPRSVHQEAAEHELALERREEEAGQREQRAKEMVENTRAALELREKEVAEKERKLAAAEDDLEARNEALKVGFDDYLT